MVVEATRERCPPAAAVDVAEARRIVSRPKSWAAAGAAKRALQSHVDTLEAAIARKNSVIARLADEMSRCRRDGDKTPA